MIAESEMKMGNSSNSIRVLIADDHPLIRNGIASLLTANDIDVIGEASDGFEAQLMAHQLDPDAIIMDIDMPYCNGFEATRLIKSKMPLVKIIILTAFADDEYELEAIKNGADAFLLKNFRAEQLLALLSKQTGKNMETIGKTVDIIKH